jgi:hypothetical protein
VPQVRLAIVESTGQRVSECPVAFRADEFSTIALKRGERKVDFAVRIFQRIRERPDLVDAPGCLIVQLQAAIAPMELAERAEQHPGRDSAVRAQAFPFVPLQRLAADPIASPTTQDEQVIESGARRALQVRLARFFPGQVRAASAAASSAQAWAAVPARARCLPRAMGTTTLPLDTLDTM